MLVIITVSYEVYFGRNEIEILYNRVASILITLVDEESETVAWAAFRA